MTDSRALQQVLGTTYTISRELGGGGMSRVFVATEHALGREVVIKTIAPELLQGVSAERFALEVKLAARLQQANIVPLLSAGDADGVPFYTMPFVSGLSLRARLSQGPVSVTEATHILRDIAKALAYAHAQGVVHRDIKPENVLLSGGTAIVTDFGIAKALSASRTEAGAGVEGTNALTVAGSSVGTPAYMAPEQALGGSVDQRADLYAWGLIGYELLCGAHPFAASVTPQKMIAAHIAEQPSALSTRNREVPAQLAAVVMRCLEKDPERRPASADELLAALDSVGSGSAPRPARAPGLPRWLKNAAAAAGLIVASVIAWNESSRSGKETRAAASDHSIVVLPFSSVGGDTANQYFAEGMADEVTTALSRVPGVRIAGRSSAARLKARNASPQEIGSALNVSAVLDGTVRRSGNRIRVSAELTKASDGTILWKDQYEREVKEVFSVQDDITRAIVGALQVQLAGGGSSIATSSQGTTNLQAYDLYLRSLQLYRQRGAGLRQAESLLTRAIELDPQYARAHAALASVLMVQPYYFNDVSVRSVVPRAKAAAERAKMIDDQLADGHLAVGYVAAETFQWETAEAELKRATELNPNNAEAAFRLGFMFLGRGRIRDANTWFGRAVAIDPFYSVATVYHALTLAMENHRDQAVAEAQRALSLDPAGESVASLYANTLEIAGHCSDARTFAVARGRASGNIRRQGLHFAVAAACGARDEARSVRDRIAALPAASWGRLSSLAYLDLSLGDTARALDVMEQAFAGDGDLLLSQSFASPRYDAVRRSARFAAIVRKLGIDSVVLTQPLRIQPNK